MQRIGVTIMVLFLAAGLHAGSGRAEDPAEPVYRFDPALSNAPVRPPTLSAPPLIVSGNGQGTHVLLPTDAGISPYVEYERAPELSLEQLKLLKGTEESSALFPYRVETGVSLLVENKASINLGYCFRGQPSLLGDLRVSFELKVPFD